MFLDLVSVAHCMLDNEGPYTQRKSRHARVGHKGQLTMLCLRGRLETDILIERTALFAAFSLQQATGESATAYTMAVDDYVLECPRSTRRWRSVEQMGR